jgi:hypothetical protein
MKKVVLPVLACLLSSLWADAGNLVYKFSYFPADSRGGNYMVGENMSGLLLIGSEETHDVPALRAYAAPGQPRPIRTVAVRPVVQVLLVPGRLWWDKYYSVTKSLPKITENGLEGGVYHDIIYTRDNEQKPTALLRFLAGENLWISTGGNDGDLVLSGTANLQRPAPGAPRIWFAKSLSGSLDTFWMGASNSGDGGVGVPASEGPRQGAVFRNRAIMQFDAGLTKETWGMSLEEATNHLIQSVVKRGYGLPPSWGGTVETSGFSSIALPVGIYDGEPSSE